VTCVENMKFRPLEISLMSHAVPGLAHRLYTNIIITIITVTKWHSIICITKLDQWPSITCTMMTSTDLVLIAAAGSISPFSIISQQAPNGTKTENPHAGVFLLQSCLFIAKFPYFNVLWRADFKPYLCMSIISKTPFISIFVPIRAT